jgi:hypothetical protein
MIFHLRMSLSTMSCKTKYRSRAPAISRVVITARHRGHGRPAAFTRFGPSVHRILLLPIPKLKKSKTGAFYKALGCERGVLVDLVGLHAPVTSRRAFSRGPPRATSPRAAMSAGDEIPPRTRSPREPIEPRRRLLVPRLAGGGTGTSKASRGYRGVCAELRHECRTAREPHAPRTRLLDSRRELRARISVAAPCALRARCSPCSDECIDRQMIKKLTPAA